MLQLKPREWIMYLSLILLVNVIIRLIIYDHTVLFSFSDYRSYFDAVDMINENGSIKLKSGNFLFAISYIGYFAKYVLGNIDYFFWFNCLLGTATTLIISLITLKITGSKDAGLISALILTCYPEFMVFSSVFYTPVLMLFLLSIFLLLIYYYLNSGLFSHGFIFLIIILVVYLTTFLLKPELIFLPFFIITASFLSFKKKELFRKCLYLSLVLFAGILIVVASGIYSKKENDVIANDFIFFGHTDYGGDLGEGSFVYPENKARYDVAWNNYVTEKNLANPTLKNRNSFQILEIKKFIFKHPFEWTRLQGTKFFRTFGVVPETTSFKVLYTGMFRKNLWLTSVLVVAPVAIIILLFILFFNLTSLKRIISSDRDPLGINTRVPVTDHRHRPPELQRRWITDNKHFIYIYSTLFIYYLTISIFLGQYQERYRLPLMVVFIIPALSYFIASLNKKQFLNKSSLIVKSTIILLFLIIWTFQTRNALSNTERLKNALESVKE